MKTPKLTLIISFIICFSGSLFCQDLDGLSPFAHYPLNQTPDDALGLQNPMVLINTVYDDDDGIYFNGKHPVVDQGGSWARTTYMSALYDSKFAVQVEFKMEDIDGQVRCILVCGLSTFSQYLGLFVLESGDFTILLSDGVFIDIPDVNPQENVWYKLTMVYDTVSNNAKFYLGNNLIESANHNLVRGQGDAFVNNYYPSGGYPLKGNWRNLRIYGEEEISALEDELARASALQVFPNPASESIMIEAKDPRGEKWNIYDVTGRPVRSGDFQSMNPIDIHLLVQGKYILQLIDVYGRTLDSRMFSKM